MTAREDVESLIGVYSLDALSAEEARRVEAVAAGDPLLAERLRLDLAVAAALAEGLVGPDERAPAALWRKIDAATRPERATRLRSRPRRHRLTAMVAAASLAAVVVLAAVVARQVGEIGRFHENPLAVAAEDARREPGARAVSLQGEVPVEVVLATDGTGYLLAPAAPALPAGRTYQLWAIVGDRVISAGVLGPHPEVAAFHVDGEVAGFALTVEVAGGVVASGQEPVAVGFLEG